MTFSPNDHKWYSVKQAAKLMHKSYRTVCNYIDRRTIKYILIDTFRAIHQDEIDKVNEQGIVHKPKFTLEGYKTVGQAAKFLGINVQNLKKYVLEERIANIKKNGVYFIPDVTITAWNLVDNPNPNTVEAHKMEAMLIRDAARTLNVCDSKCRKMILEGELEYVDGYCRRYVTKSSIQKYIDIRDMLGDL